MSSSSHPRKSTMLFSLLVALTPLASGYAHLGSSQDILPRQNSDCPYWASQWQSTPTAPMAGHKPLAIDESVNYYEYHANDEKKGKYKRSSCPAMNTLANRGFIPRTGRNITATQFLDATRKVFNFGDDNIWVVVAPTFALHGSPATIDLDYFNDAKVQRAVNCMAAPTRNDIELGDNIKMNMTLYKSLMSFTKDGETLTLEDMAEHHHLRHNQSRAENPKWRFGHLEATCALAQYTNMYGVLGRPGKHGLTTLFTEDVETFYLKEDLPKQYQRREMPYWNPEASAYMDRMAHAIGFELQRPFPAGDGTGDLSDVEPVVAKWQKPCGANAI